MGFVGLSMDTSPVIQSVSGQGGRLVPGWWAAERREPVVELTPRPEFPGASASAALLLLPPLSLRHGCGRVSLLHRAPALRVACRQGAGAPSPGQRSGARRESLGEGAVKGEGAGGGRSRERGSGEGEASEGEWRSRAKSESEGEQREGGEKDTRKHRHPGTGIPLEKSEPIKG